MSETRVPVTQAGRLLLDKNTSRDLATNEWLLNDILVIEREAYDLGQDDCVLTHFPLRLTIQADGSISRIAGGPLEEPVDTGPTLLVDEVTTAMDRLARYGGIISVIENANEQGWPIHVATRTTCAEHIEKGDDGLGDFAFAQAQPQERER